jgi:circadian clock protein KaiC
MGHSNQVREFMITSKGVNLVPVAVGPQGVLTGSARLNHEAELRAQDIILKQEMARRQRNLERHKARIEAEIEALRGQYAAEVEETEAYLSETEQRERDSSAAALRRALARTGGRGGNGHHP